MALDSVITSGVMAVSSLLAGFIAAQTGNPHIGGLSVVALSVLGVAIWFVWARGR
jgi:hypothetical protein